LPAGIIAAAGGTGVGATGAAAGSRTAASAADWSSFSVSRNPSVRASEEGFRISRGAVPRLKKKT